METIGLQKVSTPRNIELGLCHSEFLYRCFQPAEHGLCLLALGILGKKCDESLLGSGLQRTYIQSKNNSSPDALEHKERDVMFCTADHGVCRVILRGRESTWCTLLVISDKNIRAIFSSKSTHGNLDCGFLVKYFELSRKAHEHRDQSCWF